MKSFLPYFDSEFSFAQFRVPDMKPLVSFGSEANSIIVLSDEGSYYYASFDPNNGGECTLLTYKNILETSNLL